MPHLLPKILLLMLAIPSVGLADCAPAIRINARDLSLKTDAIRAAVYEAACKRLPGGLFDAQDAELGGRVVEPLRWANTPKPAYPDKLVRMGIEGSAIIAIIVETDGRIAWASVLESSGNSELDDAMLKFTRSSRFAEPVKLDNQPIRAFLTRKVTFSLRP